MNRFIPILFICLWSLQGLAQTGQLEIPRISQMPDLPSPLSIRDWETVARDYDNFVFDFNKTGQYLPLSKNGTPGQFNYTDNTPVYIDTYVGANSHLNQAEAINIMPAVVGASLIGINKSSQSGKNWVAATKDFFNLKNGQNVYLNNYSTKSGNDWWYDVMPNVYFYQLKALYPGSVPEFDNQFVTVADRWLYCTKQLGGNSTPWAIPNMNYRAFNLGTGLPLTTGVPEPESAGSIAWLLYNAYLETGSRKYWYGAQQAMDFLTGFSSNPSYELQLPYGTITAARMNAVEGTNYPLQKLLDWCFNKGDLRGWGAIVGNWGGYDVSGLIGEANDNGNDYAFIMNGFQQAAALAPLPKYDKRYARAIAKWILNITTASRMFYWNALPENLQDSYAWASVNDPAACIPHESMKQVWTGKTPFATGDALKGGWAATNLSLYSGSSVGYLAAVVQKTNIPEILRIDLNKTDFYGDNAFPTYLYFNPTPATKQVDVTLPQGTFGIYEAITETTLFTSASGTIQLTIPAGEVRMIRLFSAGATPEARGNKLYLGNKVLDYHYQYGYSGNLRIKSIATSQNPVLANAGFTAYCEPGNVKPGKTVQYEWFLDDVLIPGKDQPQVSLSAPQAPSQPILKCRITSDGEIAEDTLHLKVLVHFPTPPVVTGIMASSKYSAVNAPNTFTAIVTPSEGEILTCFWSASTGQLEQNSGKTVTWQAPATPSVNTITLKVTNQDLLSTTVSTSILVKDTAFAQQAPLIYYPFDFDTQNATGNRFHATATGVTKTDDSRGVPGLAYQFTSGSNIIYTENQPDLNFTGAVTLSCWMKCSQFDSERFIISHGSWQQRYKISITPEGRIRWTIKTSTGVSDLDGSAPIELNSYYHIVAVYTGYSMELYVDGALDTFKALTGDIQPSTKPLTIGRMDNVETQYALRGSIDEVKVWDKEIPVPQIDTLKNLWLTSAGIEEDNYTAEIYPNPADDFIMVQMKGAAEVQSISLCNISGLETKDYKVSLQPTRIDIEVSKVKPGMYLLRVILKDGRVIMKKVCIV